MKKDRFEGYIPTPLRRRLGLPVPGIKAAGKLFDRIDSTGGNNKCWPWLGPLDRYGYGFVTRKGRAHRLAWQEHNGRKLAPHEVIRHSCDNPCCCNPAHLLVGTQEENVRDRVDRNRGARGSTNGRAKLTAAEAIAIFKAEQSTADLARKYNLDESTVRGIRSGKTWGWATGQIPKKPLQNPKTKRVTQFLA